MDKGSLKGTLRLLACQMRDAFLKLSTTWRAFVEEQSGILEVMLGGLLRGVPLGSFEHG